MATERKSIISATWDKAAGTITFGVLNVGQIVLDLSKTSGTDETAKYHGYEQKVRDAAAIPRDPTTGASATPQEKFDAMQAIVENLHNGVWNVKGGVEKALNRGALFEAVAEVRSTADKPITSQEVEARFRDRPDEVLRAFLTHKDIAAAYAKRTTRDNGAADKLLAELE